MAAAAAPAEGWGFNRELGDYRVYGEAEMERIFKLAIDSGLPSIDKEGVASMTANVRAGRRDAKHYIELYTARLVKHGVDVNAGAPKSTDARAQEASVRGGLAFSAPATGSGAARATSKRRRPT